jgi:N-acetylglucosamine kinase-like BadF-type ATPase
MSRLFLGVDGGQSSTIALLGDATGRVVGHGRGGPCNHVEGAEGRAKFVGVIRDCVNAACAEACLDPSAVEFASACLGLSGGPHDKEPILRNILRAERMQVTHDALIALVGATAGEPGVVVIAGTGSIAFGRNAQGETARAGGWGYIFGDEGGAFDIARQGLRAALRWEEGWGAPTMLHRILLEVTRSNSANELMHRFYASEFSREAIARMAIHVDDAAQAGDLEARAILRSAADRLSELARAVQTRLFGGQSPRVAYIGGVFRSAVVLTRFRELIETTIAPKYGPAAGALIEAYRASGIQCALTNVPEEKM